jgi:hypothetical protein
MAEQGSQISATGGRMVALLCISDSGQDVPLALKSVYGQPYLHHLVKALERIGIERFFVAIDSVPGALLGYCDWANGQGIDIGCLRNPAELASQVDGDARVLALTADTIWHIALLQDAIGQDRPLIATVEEQVGNQHFERIDLNNRWAGLAVLKPQTLAKLTELPEGWDIGSALLRQAQQDGVAHWPIAQKQVQAGKLHKLLPADDIAVTLSQVSEVGSTQPKSLETYLFATLCRRLQPFIWATSWSRTAVEWLFPGLALLSAALSISEFALPSAAIAVLAVFAAALRLAARALEYQADKPDGIGALGWTFMGAALGATVFHETGSFSEAAFLTGAIIALSLFASKYWNRTGFWISSPLLLTLIMLIGFALALGTAAIKLVILAELAALLLSQITSKRDEQIPIDRA